ncbi:MAG: 2-C-methyl-D-erythritol 4-phosphate cytidylyltransferase [Candidatus Limnocylindrales bacterium]
MNDPSPAGIADAIVVAAGSSRRMGGLDKLDWSLGGRPLLAHTLERLAACPEVGVIVLVASAQRQPALASAAWLPDKVRATVAGGQRRQDSVVAGFRALEGALPDPAGERVVLVHDGARPLVTASLVGAVVTASLEHGAAIPVTPVVDTIKRIADGRVVETIEREGLAAAQTPQGVRRSVFRRALAALDSEGLTASRTWTDEAALLEACRIPVHAVSGDPTNIKVTVPADLARAAQLLSVDQRAAPSGTRTGIGHDSHPFGSGQPLWLGGIEFPGVPRLHGHSDGDTVLHAVADALLGAAGAGDLGRLFPADATTPAGIASGRLLRTVVERIAEAGWRPGHVDLLIVAGRPRLAGRLETMGVAIAGLLGVSPEAVNVKASTGNLDGSEGAGRSISALAVATVVPIR